VNASIDSAETPRASSREKIVKILLLIGRIVLALIFLVAAVSKLRPLPGMPWTVPSVRISLAMFSMGIDAYQILPTWAVSPLAHFLPFAELVLGLWLLFGFALRLSSLVSALLICVFITAMYSAYRRGLTGTCGCFGQGGGPIGLLDLFRDSLFLLLSLALFVGTFFTRRKSPQSSNPDALPVAQVGH
jgi:uncharacterized membrane protein YphA (DoxX/SURF4 family)